MKKCFRIIFALFSSIFLRLQIRQSICFFPIRIVKRILQDFSVHLLLPAIKMYNCHQISCDSKNSLLKNRMAAEFLKNFYRISDQKENFIGMNKKLIGIILVSFMLKKCRAIISYYGKANLDGNFGFFFEGNLHYIATAISNFPYIFGSFASKLATKFPAKLTTTNLLESHNK